MAAAASFVDVDQPLGIESECDFWSADRDAIVDNLNSAFLRLNKTETSMIRVQAERYLCHLRQLLGNKIQIDSDIRIEFSKKKDGDLADFNEYLHSTFQELNDSLARTHMGFPNKIMFVNMMWAKKPNFHVDEASLTIVFPIHQAPTIFIGDRFVSGEAPSNLPLDALAHTAPVHTPLIRTCEDEIVLLKGVAWSGAGNAAVHSPPFLDSLTTSSHPRASVLIVEYRELNCRAHA